MPMDETLGMAAVDFCGRTAISVDTKVNLRLVGDLQSELVHDFLEGFARGALKAAQWVVGKKGFYEFADVIFG